MKTILVLFGLLLALFLGISFAQNYLKNNPSFLLKTPTATINNHTFSLKVAKTDKEKEIGLSNLSSLPKNQGMIFPFQKADYYPFWMRDMKFPIDIIFIKENKIVTIHQNLQPPKTKTETIPIYRPDEPADTVLEINSGLSKEYGFKKGDPVKLQNL